MRIGLYQSPSPAGDLSAGFDTIAAALAAAAEMQIEMLVLPELFLPGYSDVATTPPAGWDQVPERLAGLCRAAGVGLTLGLPLYEGATVANAASAFAATGEVLARYRKIQLFGPHETARFTPGDSYVVFDYRGVRFGLLICYDVEFPEHVRALAQAGAEVVLVPTANMMPYVNVSQILIPARAAENALTIVYANYCGSDGTLDYVGDSVIAGPDGYPLAAKGQRPGLLVAELPSDWREHDIPLSTQLQDLVRVEGQP